MPFARVARSPRHHPTSPACSRGPMHAEVLCRLRLQSVRVANGKWLKLPFGMQGGAADSPEPWRATSSAIMRERARTPRAPGRTAGSVRPADQSLARDFASAPLASLSTATSPFGRLDLTGVADGSARKYWIALFLASVHVLCTYSAASGGKTAAP
jgi:hypothetical protein